MSTNEGWKEFTDATTGRKYYYNTLSRETQWTMPEGFISGLPQSPVAPIVPQKKVEPIALPTLSTPTERVNTPTLNTPTDRIVSPTKKSYEEQPKARRQNTEFRHSMPSDSVLSAEFSQSSSNLKRRSFSGLSFLGGGERPTFVGGSPNSPQRPTLPKRATGQHTLVKYGNEHFNRVKRGLFKSVVKTDKVLEFQKKPITAPLHKNINTEQMIQKSLRCFELLMLYMKDKKYKEMSINVKQLFKTEGEATPFAIVKELLTQALQIVQLRDELIVCICKQCTKNPKADSVLLGIQLLAIMLASFPPAKLELQEAVLYFLQIDLPKQASCDQRVNGFVSLAEKRLRRALISGPRKTIPSDHEIRSIDNLHPPQPVFGVTIQEYMEWQKEKYPQADQTQPYILSVLLKGLEDINGLYTEGIFRLPGNTQQVEELKDKFLSGTFTIDKKYDAHVIASVFKLWLRELADPPIPNELYNTCIEVAQDMEQCIDRLKYLPVHNGQVLAFVIRFLAKMCDDRVQEQTKMTIENLAVVFSPNILRNQSTDPLAIMKNSSAEKMFVKNLINWKLGKND